MMAVWAGAQAQSNDETIETVTVTGFKASLERALDMKRNALGASDTIMSEDIAKFPDLNVSESLQRIPGVAVQRDAGEGRQISVRGLGPQFTRVRVNGMEAVATSGGSDSAGTSSGGSNSGGTNRGRSFDFNVFGSELFSNLTAYKSAGANLEEGSLGATVDMHTARPFDFNRFVFSASATGGYNALAGSFNPRASFLVSDILLNGKLGVLFSASYSSRRLIEDGTSTVRWQNDNTDRASNGAAPGLSGCTTVTGARYQCSLTQRFASVNGATSGTAYDLVNEAFHPRMPRYDLYHTSNQRIGLSSVVQWQPADETQVTLSALFSDYSGTREESYLESTTLSTSGTTAGIGIHQAAVTDYHVNETTNTLEYVVANNVGLRVEQRLDHLDTRFGLVSLEGTHTFSDKFKTSLFFGWSESHFRNPMQTTVTMDLLNVQGYSYDFRDNARVPKLGYGNADLTATGSTLCTASTASCNAWYLSQLRMRPNAAFNSFRNTHGEFEYDVMNGLKVMGGYNVKNFGFRAQDFRLSNGTGSNFETVQSKYGTVSSPAEQAFLGSVWTNIQNTPLSSYTHTVTLPKGGLSLGQGTPTAWIAPDVEAASKVLGFTALPLGIEPARGTNRSVRENDFGGWLQVGWDTLFYGIPLRGDIGGRMVETEQSSTGNSYNASGVAEIVTIRNNYHDFLPSLNMVFEPTDTFLIRLNLSQVMARPDLGDLAGTAVSVSGANRTITIGNPHLKPYRANTIDLAYEWYYHKGAMLSLGMFYKKIGTYVQSSSGSSTGNATTGVLSYTADDGEAFTLSNDVLTNACGGVTGCAATGSWTISKSINTPGGNVEGIEVNWHQPFDFLPAPFEDFGVLANATYVESSVLNGTAADAVRITMLNQSKISYSTTFYYDNGTFQGRMSASYRGRYTTRYPGRTVNDMEGTGATLNVDASASYKLNDNLTLTLDAINLTNEHQFQYVDSVGERLSVNHQTGREVYLGVRYSF